MPELAAGMRRSVGFDVEERRRCRTWVEAMREFVGRVETLGVLVMASEASGVVGSNSRRKLDAGEFRGFALADSFAPMIFINSADTKAAQMFTLAHELAHVWLGSSGVSDAQSREPMGPATEHWCNRVAAEMLVPLDVLKKELPERTDLGDELRRLARRFKVSTLVILRRITGWRAISVCWSEWRIFWMRTSSTAPRTCTTGSTSAPPGRDRRLVFQFFGRVVDGRNPSLAEQCDEVLRARPCRPGRLHKSQLTLLEQTQRRDAESVEILQHVATLARSGEPLVQVTFRVEPETWRARGAHWRAVRTR